MTEGDTVSCFGTEGTVLAVEGDLVRVRWHYDGHESAKHRSVLALRTRVTEDNWYDEYRRLHPIKTWTALDTMFVALVVLTITIGAAGLVMGLL